MSSENNLSTAIAVLFENEMTETGLSELEKKYPADLVHDMTDETQFKAARKVKTERNKLVDRIKVRRINVTSDIKIKADELTSKVESIYATVVKPFEIQNQKNKDAKEKAERELKELLDRQRIEINDMNNFVSDCVGKTSESIAGVIEAVDLIDTTFFHKDIIHEAIEVKKTVTTRLAELLTLALNEEALQVERDKLAKQQEEVAAAQLVIDLKAKAQERLNNLMMIPAGFFGKQYHEIENKIASLKKYEILESEFGELFEQANQSKIKVVEQLEVMAQQQLTVDNAQAEKANTLSKSLNEQSTPVSEEAKQGRCFSRSFTPIDPKEGFKKPFEHAELKASPLDFQSIEAMRYFFGEEEIGDLSRIDDDNEYQLEVILRRVES